jgi:hypothetical protein
MLPHRHGACLVARTTEFAIDPDAGRGSALWRHTITQERESNSTSKDDCDKNLRAAPGGSAGPPMDYADAAVEPLPMSMGDAQPRPRPPEGPPSPGADLDAGRDPTVGGVVQRENPHEQVEDSR